MDAGAPRDSPETAALVALIRAGARSPAVLSDLIEQGASPRALLEDEQGLLAAQSFDEAAAEIARWAERGIRVLTLLDADYPANLRAVYDRPPMLFTAGRLESQDSRSIAVIGSRRASADGLGRARAITEHVVELGYAVVSGLAAGIDTVAHQTVLARGGRTIAVIGTGLAHSYPPENTELQRRIAAEGLVVSQFLPDVGPDARNFPQRNALMSGLALASIIVAATRMSGARTQARAALAHGRPVLLTSSLLAQDWARELAARPGVHVFGSPSELDDVLGRLTAINALVA
jgi:DNA processing protein